MLRTVKIDVTVSLNFVVNTEEFSNNDGSECTIEECIDDIVEQIDLEGAAISNLRKMGYRKGVNTEESFDSDHWIY